MPQGNGKMPDEKDHDLLVRLDEKMDGLGKTLSALVASLDQRGTDIDELKTARLLHEQETKRHLEDAKMVRERVDQLEADKKVIKEDIETLKNTSIWLWGQRHPKLAWIILITFLIMLNFHDIIVPWLFSIFGYKTP